MTTVCNQEQVLQEFDTTKNTRLKQMAPRDSPNTRRYLSLDDGSRMRMFIVALWAKEFSLYKQCNVYTTSLKNQPAVKWLRFFLTELRFFLPWQVFQCFFLACKANAKVKLAKTGHGSHSTTLACIRVVRMLLFVLFGSYYLCCSMYCLCVNVYCHRVYCS
jgi:hypothetical protein